MTYDNISGDSAVENAADSTGTVQWRMERISGGHRNGGCGGYQGDSAMEDGADIMRWVETTEDEDCTWKKV